MQPSRKVSILFYVHEGLKNLKKLNANFSILGPKNAKKRLKIFLFILYKFMDYNEVWFSRSTFHEKAKKKFKGCSILSM